VKVTILGCGRWASFHAWYNAAILKNDVLVWGRSNDGLFAELKKNRKNKYLEIPKSVKFTNDLDLALNYADYITIAISSQGMPTFSRDIGALKPKNKTFILSMKGIIDNTGERLSQVLRKHVHQSNKIVVWVGPGHAQELSKGQPNIMVIDGEDPAAVEDVVQAFKSKLVRLYEGDDIIGSEIGAAAKNVLGIAAGLLDGAGMPSLKGALMARGVYEVAKLIVAMGGKQLTAYGIAHLGDFEATLFSQNSNNRRYGEMLYRGEKSEYLAEGVSTSKAVHMLAQKHNVEMPVCRLVYKILYEEKDLDQGLSELFERDNAKEFRF